MITTSQRTIDLKDDIPYYSITLCIALLTSALIFTYVSPTVNDWWGTFYPASNAWLSPYDGGFHFAYPPWMAAILSPLSLFNANLARLILNILTILACAFCNRILKGDLISFTLFMTSIPTIVFLGNGQVDGIPIFGLALIVLGSKYSEIIGSIYILAKPQSFAFVLPLLWLKSDYRKELTYAGILFLLFSFLVWGWWIPLMLDMIQDLYVAVNIAPWPYGIPVGIALLYLGYKKEDLIYGALATFFFTPYIAFYSFSIYTIILYARLPRKWAVAFYILLMLISGLYIRYVVVDFV